jgi:hypothetical protein
MKPPEPPTLPAPAVTGSHAGNLEALAAALRHETERVTALRDALREQRAGIAANRTDRVEDSVREVGHLLLGIDEQRRHRSALLERLTGDPNVELARLESAVTPALPRALVEARRALRHAANEVAREVAINHEVLKRSIEAGESYLQALFSSVRGPEVSYHPGDPRSADHPTGVIMNRRA